MLAVPIERTGHLSYRSYAFTFIERTLLLEP